MRQKIFNYSRQHKKFLLILIGIVALNMIYGFDARFTIINLLWIFINVIKL
ncbi:MAG: hypothetical protein JWQ27_2890 [Ferruginibacter sp.]|nr:hypothetical protein [Ferruginibacter sp.]